MEKGFYPPKLPSLFTLEEANEFFKNKGIIDEELRGRAVDNYLEVIGHTTEEVEATGDISCLGDYGEYIIVENDAPKVTKIHYRVYINGEPHTVDIVETDRVIESKYWSDRDSYDIRFASPKALDELANELKACKYVMEQEGLEKVCLIFGKKYWTIAHSTNICRN